VSISLHTLLILSCSSRKRRDINLLPAIERYDGPAFRLIRRFLNEESSVLLDISILSAKFGLISANLLIPNYDQRMTRQRAQELNRQAISGLEEILTKKPYQRLCICLGSNYFHALAGYDRIIPSELSIHVADGPQGTKLAKLYDWLYGSSSTKRQKSQRVIHSGMAHLRGVEVSMAPAQVLDKAREALKQGQDHSTTYHSWYVLVDEHKVSPKWLVSYLTGLPVSSFQAREARNVLQRLGIGVHHI
jgi:hypothetical protein